MAFEKMAAGQLDKWDKKAEEVMTRNAKSSIKSHSIVGAIVFLLPLFGFETIIYAAVLWHMYYSLAGHMKQKFNFSAVVSGFIINLLVCLVANIFLDLIAAIGLGLIFAAIVGYFATYQSGTSYMGLMASKKY